MMCKFKVREALRKDIKLFSEWLYANRDKNHFDVDVFGYKSTRILAVEKNGEPAGFLPLQFTLMTDAFAPKPGMSKLGIAMVLKTALHEVARLAKKFEIGEIHFLCDPKDEETMSLALAHGYEALNLQVMRLKPGRMNPPLPEDVKE
jgi:hypothetical protein